MILKKIIAAVSAGIMAFGFMSALKAPTVNAASITVSDYYADYTEVTFKSVEGEDITLYVSGGQLGVDSDCASSVSIKIKDKDFYQVFQASAPGSGLWDVADNLEVDKLYYIDFGYIAAGISHHQWDVFITKTESGDVVFVKSVVYDSNVERCSELWTDDQSLEECLQPQNDVECDNPYVIAIAESITEGCSSDWEKSYAIYKYIVSEYAYDYVQLEDDDVIYQDDALTLLRRKIAICEGMANTFVALCRAVEVPAAVSFGIGSDSFELTSKDSILNDEDPNHAWACVCLDGTWYHVDPTWDCFNRYDGDSFYGSERTDEDSTFDFYLLPLEVFSMTHKICDADTIHGIEESGSCGDNATYKISRDGTITIYGSGELKLPYGCNGFNKVVFDPSSSITSIGDECFFDCDLITSIVIPDTVTSIGNFAFYTCEDLEYVVLPEGLEYIGKQAFDVCDELAYVYVPDSVTTIGMWAFDNASRLVLSVPDTFTLLDYNYDISPLRIIYREIDE